MICGDELLIPEYLPTLQINKEEPASKEKPSIYFSNKIQKIIDNYCKNMQEEVYIEDPDIEEIVFQEFVSVFGEK